MIKISSLSKTYDGGFQALKNINLDIQPGEIFALLGPNGAGKTTLISIICGIVTASSGTVKVDGYDIVCDYRRTRAMIGLVPQELTADAFETVWDTVTLSRGMFGLAANRAHIEQVLRDLSLWDKRKSPIMTLSGGMKRRVMIAKALAHEPQVLFLDEPTAGVDVELRRDMWNLVYRLRESGVTIVLTTHYIQEAEEMADRIGVIRRGELILTDDKSALIAKLGRKQLILNLQQPLSALPAGMADWDISLEAGGNEMHYHFNAGAERASIPQMLKMLETLGIAYTDLQTRQSSLEEIFVDLVREPAESAA